MLERAPEAPDDRVAAMFAQVHARLLRRARSLMAGERAGHTLEPDALVHEVFLRLQQSAELAWRDERHFEAIAAKAMRQVLVDHAKARQRGKRRHDAHHITLAEGVLAASGAAVVDVLALEEALAKLAARDPRAGQVVELRLFSAMTVREVAATLELGYDAAKDDWLHARAWLAKELGR